MKEERLRQKILACFVDLAELQNKLITRKPMARGTVYELKTKCGKKNCRCMRGKLHKQMCIAITAGGKKRLRSLRGRELEKLEKLTNFHRGFRKARVKFIERTKEIVKLVNQLEEKMIKKGAKLK